MSKFNFEAERELKLEAIGVGQIKKCYNIIFWFLIVFTSIIELLLLISFIILLNGFKVSEDPTIIASNIALLIKIILYAISTPFIVWIAWICFKPLVGLIYDVKMMKYKYFADQKQEDTKFSNISEKKDLNGYSQEEILREADNFGKRIQMPKRELVIEKPNQKYELTIDEIAELIEKHSKK